MGDIMFKNKYSNPYIKDIKRTFWHFLKWQLGHYGSRAPNTMPPADFEYPIPDKQLIKNEPRVVWINHSTFLIDIDGVKILTDPIWAKRCSPFNFIGPKRKHEPFLAIEDLPEIDVVLISHNHYDHLDKQSVKALHQKFPNIMWFIPIGVAKWFSKRGIHKVKELKWWEEMFFYIPEKKAKLWISSVPAQHHSGRGIFDANRSLWMGFVVKAFREKMEPKSFYFVGDTAYNEHDFKKIGELFPQIDLCLCPIGTYQPDEFMLTVHSNPDQAVQIHIDTKAKLSIGMHWKTFHLSDEAPSAPPYDLYLAMQNRGLNPSHFLPLEPGIEINW